MAKPASHMSSAPTYIVYGHRQGVRIALRVIASGIVLAALAAVLVGASKIGGAGTQPVTVPEITVPTGTTTTPVGAKPAKPPARPHRPKTPLPPPAKIPVTVLNANGVNGAARTLSAKLSALGYPIRYVGDAQGRGTPTMVQFRAPYGPAARRLARQIGDVRYVSLPDGLTSADFRGAKIVVILGS